MTVLSIAHALIVLWLAVYGLQSCILLILYLRHRGEATPTPSADPADLPQVTVQIPVYNERHVVERVIDRAALLDYPRDKLQIQVLDDSTDDTVRLVQTRIAVHRARGVNITVVRRPNREGFKAGAMNWAMAQVRGEYIAIFDADFCPRPDFLLKTIPHFLDRPKLGVVQTRWSHLNSDYSTLTLAQAMIFDAHFAIEQVARCRSGLFMNFNGTGGVWRRRCIEEAGGWQHDTLTEDLDLSYRAQLAGWEFLYLPDVDVPAELPPQISGFKQQQFRWSQGTTQTMRKLVIPILRSREIGWRKKLMGLMHLSSYLAHALMVANLLLTLPMMLIPDTTRLPMDALGLACLGPSLVFIIAQKQLYPNWWRRLRALPMMSALGIGIAWCSTRAAWRGLTRWGGTFNRTPKFQLEGKQGLWLDSSYRLQADDFVVGEIVLALYALVTTIVALVRESYAVVPCTLMYAVAFGVVAGMGMVQRNTGTHRKRPVRTTPTLKMIRRQQEGGDG